MHCKQTLAQVLHLPTYGWVLKESCIPRDSSAVFVCGDAWSEKEQILFHRLAVCLLSTYRPATPSEPGSLHTPL